jgi:DNA primase
MELEKIKQKLSIEEVLNYYGISNLKRTGNSLYGPCPVHGGDNPRAFNVSIDKNLWNCFTHCGGGSVIDLIMKMENISLYDAILKAEQLAGNYKTTNKMCRKPVRKKKNNPLEFKLTLEPKHPYLEKRGVKQETAKYFGIGYCKYGILKGRIAIPIYDDKARLVAYCGRAVNNKKPKYRFPKGFRKNLVLYNYHNVKNSEKKEVVVVEGYFDLYRVYQAGYSCVSLMGRTISPVQEQLLVSLNKKLILMFDGDEPGKEATKKAIEQLKGKIGFRVVSLRDNTQPDNLTEGKLKSLIG